MRIIDFHSHFFSRPFFEALAAQGPGEGSLEERLDALALRTGIEIPLPSVADHAGRWVEDLDALEALFPRYEGMQRRLSRWLKIMV